MSKINDLLYKQIELISNNKEIKDKIHKGRKKKCQQKP